MMKFLMGRPILAEWSGKILAMRENELKCCVSGSYSKYWAEIKQTINEFKKLGIEVVEPSGEWVLKPYSQADFKPLSNEKDLRASQVEEIFLLAILKSSFLYLDNRQGYFGDTASFEVGFALGNGKRIFMRETPSHFLDIHPEMLENVTVAKPEEIPVLLNAGEKRLP